MKKALEVAREITRLHRLKKLLPAHAAEIEAQIVSLTAGMDEDAIYNQADDGITAEEELWNERERDAALNAFRWRNEDSFSAPSADWEPLVKPKS